MFSTDLAKDVARKIPRLTTVPEKPNFIRDPDGQVMVLPGNLHEVCVNLRDNPQYLFDLPLQMTAVDYWKENIFELVYCLYSTKLRQGLVLKTQVPRSGPEIDSVSDVWPGMNWQEREVYDLFGITFKSHPYLKRILMWEGFPGYPLRKDYVHLTDRYDSGLEIGTPGLDEKGIPIPPK